jgi:hypothetical protein
MTRAKLPIGLALVLAAALGLAACSSAPTGGLSVTPGPNAVASLLPAEEATPGPSEAASADDASPAASPAAALDSPVRGIVLHVDSPSLGTVTDFTLLTDDNTQVLFKVGVIENAAAFPAAHLTEHMAASQPVLVYFRVTGSALVVYRLEDAAPMTASPSQPADSASDAPAAS